MIKYKDIIVNQGDGASVNALTQDSSVTIYAPTEQGTSGQVLTSTGSGAPVWKDNVEILQLSKGQYAALSEEQKQNENVIYEIIDDVNVLQPAKINGQDQTNDMYAFMPTTPGEIGQIFTADGWSDVWKAKKQVIKSHQATTRDASYVFKIGRLVVCNFRFYLSNYINANTAIISNLPKPKDGKLIFVPLNDGSRSDGNNWRASWKINENGELICENNTGTSGTEYQYLGSVVYISEE